GPDNGVLRDAAVRVLIVASVYAGFEGMGPMNPGKVIVNLEMADIASNRQSVRISSAANVGETAAAVVAAACAAVANVDLLRHRLRRGLEVLQSELSRIP